MSTENVNSYYVGGNAVLELTDKLLLRFWAKVDKTETCWNWTAGKTKGGYGQFGNQWYKKYAHRISYELMIGPIPDGLQIHHHCKNRACVRPSHLSVVTSRQNTLVESDSASAKNAIKTRCDHGHEFNVENTRIFKTKSGIGRECRTCHRERERKRQYQAANREKKAEYMRQYQAVNREKKAEYQRQYQAANREKMAEYNRQYYLNKRRGGRSIETSTDRQTTD